MDPNLKLKALLGKTIERIEGAVVGQDYIVFDTKEGPRYVMNHNQDCCEYVAIREVQNLDNAIGLPVDLVEEINPDLPAPEMPNESWTWTKFRIGTAKGVCEILWLGESNGYYSESVDFSEAPERAAREDGR